MINLKNLKLLTDYFEEHADESKLDMGEYCNCTARPEKVPAVYPECDTTCCFLGYGPMVPGLEAPADEDWAKDFPSYCEQVLGFGVWTDEWHFLFCELWPSSKAECVARARYVLANDGAVPYEWDFSSRYA